MVADEELQEKVIETETLRAQSEAVQQQLIVVMNTFQEIFTARAALEDIEGIKEGTEILVPLGGGSFVKGKLNDNSEVILNLGSGVMAIKTRKEAISIIDSQLTQLEDAKQKLENVAIEIELRLNQLTVELQQMLEHGRK